MAQGGAPDTLSGAALSAASGKLSGKDSIEMLQFELIARFRDAVISGKSSGHQAHPGQQDGARQPGLDPPHLTDARNRTFPGAGATALPPQKESITPSRKTADNVEAEVSIRRRALEQELRDEGEKHRLSKSSQSALYSDIDPSDVLAKAMALVPATTAPPLVGEVATDQGGASDSFDDNTFYSSQFDTPQSQMAPRIPDDLDEARSSEVLPPPTESAAQSVGETRSPRAQQWTLQPGLPAVAAAPSTVVVPGLNNYSQQSNPTTQPARNTASGEQSQSDDVIILDSLPARTVATSSRSHPYSTPYIDSHPPSPLLRGRPLQLAAPPAAQDSPLSLLGNERRMGIQPSRAAQAQVTALRHEPLTAISPDSSSRGGRTSERKKKKKKKRKADRQASGMESNPYIKVEPRSPSPLADPPHNRANKRQRHTRGQVLEAGYEPGGYGRPLGNGPVDPYPTRQYRDQHVPLGYDGGRAYPQRAVSAAVIGDQGYSREYVDDRRLPVDSQARGYGLPGPAPPYPCSPVLAYPSRQSFAGDGYREPPRAFREFNEDGRMSTRPEDELHPSQPRAAPVRVLVDAYGRQFYSGHGLPAGGPGEPNVIYERLPPRAMSRHAGPEPYGEAGIVYGSTPATTYAVPRRIVTQPIEYTPYEYRDGPQREYPTRAMTPPPPRYVEAGVATDRRCAADAPREYPVGATGMIPVDTRRYEVPQAYGRVQGVRPEMPGLSPSVHPDGRREAVQPYLREYATRPAEPYLRPQTRAADEIAFIERPRASTQAIVYADDGRREIYR
ncbi:hypothetical protein L249_4081 [Ophiocordyceps polyrhachis-furcata BCC 54312]|uniref:Uncharacterized protein n=1 Tax=Ophiocordyceps polyrhachis-furcata BCC 54312 TaxID=1330021 RepID=A0A367L501_9HYPO|nr:hypothetical protein L249_4081 [Ophiocordyceps polyrhachis-furcata BCC 54312]